MFKQYTALSHISYSLGENRIDPSSLFDDDGRVALKTGINTVHRTDKTSLDLAIESVDKLKNDYLQDIGCVIYDRLANLVLFVLWNLLDMNNLTKG